MNTIVVVHLIMVILTGAEKPETKVREFPTVAECKQAEIDIHKAVANSIGVADIGTICVKSEFDNKIKPRA